MCYGFDGEAAIERSLEDRGSSATGVGRRSFMRGAIGAAVAASAGATVLGMATPANAVAVDNARRRVPLNRVSIQLWTVRDAFGWPSAPAAEQKQRYRTVLRQIADIGYPKVELGLGYFGHTPVELRNFYRSIGVRPTSTHEGISANQAELEKRLQDAATVGARYFNVPYLEAPLTLTPAQRRSQWQAWADQMNREAEVARGYGLQYGYHNHSHEFLDDLGGGLVPMDILVEGLDPSLVHFQIDLYWLITGLIASGQAREATAETEAISFIRSVPQRVRQYHVKDRDPGQPANRTNGAQSFADPGTGMIDFGRIFDANDAEEYIIENDAPDVSPLQTARVGYRFLTQLVYGHEQNAGRGRGVVSA